MVDRNTYALLSSRVYDASLKNIIFVPQGWTELPDNPDSSITSFAARAYRNNATGEIVIAFRGTNTTITDGTIQDWETNITAGLGIPNGQVAQAMSFYESIKATYGSNISFTGHSLGGGIASLMAVFFDKQATVFDEAPFQLTAINPITVAAYGLLAPSALLDPDFLWYLANPLSLGLIFNDREDNVTNYYLEGEAVNAIRTGVTTIVGEGDDRIFTLGQSTASAIDRHDMLVLTAVQYSSGFLKALQKLPHLLTQLLDTNLFAVDRTSSDQDILSLLLRHQFGDGASIVADKMLDGFARDLNQLTPGGLIKNAPQLEDALITALMQGYDKIEQDRKPFTTDFYHGVSGGFYFDINRIATSFNQIRTANDLVTALQTYYGLDTSIALNGFDRWYLQAGTTSLIAQDTEGKNDLMAGGSHADILQGGVGDDLLLGGQGTDIYQYRPNDGTDTIVDQDGQGLILYDPEGSVQALALGLRQSTDPEGQYKSPDNTITYQMSGSDLQITTPTGTITVKDFNKANNDLNLRLIDLPLEPSPSLPPIAQVAIHPNGNGASYTGTAAAESAVGTDGDDDFQGNGGGDHLRGQGGNDYIVSAGASPEAANAYLDGGTGRDVLIAGDGADHLVGGPDDASDREDALDGGAGNDYLEGGGGHDVLAGGPGRDVLKGGPGDDHLWGSATWRPAGEWSVTPVSYLLSHIQLTGDSYIFPTPVFVNFDGAWQPDNSGDILFGEGGSDYLQGSLGADYLDGGPEDDILDAYAGDDVLIGGAGSDWLNAGRGDDIVLAGDGNDHLFGDLDDPTAGPEGNDYLDGGAGEDYLYGHGGDDILLGGADKDELYGGAGADTLIGNTGNDELYGGPGNDTYILNLGDGQDTLTDSAGTDTLIFGPGIAPPSPTNRILTQQAGGANIDLATQPLSLRYTLNDRITLNAGSAIEQFVFTGYGNYSYPDLLTAQGGKRVQLTDPSFNSVTATADDEYIEGNIGTDIITAGGGDDTLIGGRGGDQLDGGAGDDTYLFNLGDGTDYLLPTQGTDTAAFGSNIAPSNVSVQILTYAADLPGVNLRYGTGDTLVLDTLRHGPAQFTFNDGQTLFLEALLAQPPNAHVTYTIGTATADTLSAQTDNAELWGEGGNDRLTAGSGDSLLIGGEGDDVLLGNTGWDKLYGGQGNDLFIPGGGEENYAFAYDPGAAGSPGGTGSDVYAFHRGDGYLYIDNASAAGAAGTDTLSFGPGIRPEDVYGYVDANGDLVLQLNETSDVIRIKAWAEDGSYESSIANPNANRVIQRVQFLDGDTPRVIDLVQTISSPALVAKFADVGEYGRTQIFGSNDVFTFNVGDGNRTLSGDYFYGGFLAPGTDTLTFGPGIRPEDIAVRVTDGGGRENAYADLILKLNTTGEEITVSYWGQWWNGDLISQPAIQRLAFAGDNGARVFDLVGMVEALKPGLVTAPPGATLALYTPTTAGFELADTRIFAPYELAPGSFAIAGGPQALAYAKTGNAFDPNWMNYIGGLGTAGADTQTGTLANDLLAGGAGNDILIGSGGNDTFVYRVGDGLDRIETARFGQDTLTFGAGIDRNRTVARNVTINGESIGLVRFLDAAGNPLPDEGLDIVLLPLGESPGPGQTFEFGVERFVFADGAEADLGFLQDNPSGPITIKGTDGDDSISATPGPDVIDGGVGADMISGGPGDDTLNGGAGNDTYLFNLGDGVDTIDDLAAPGEGNRIVFGSGITPDSLSLGIGSLLIRIGGQGDAIHLANFDPTDVYGPRAIETFEFADGSSIAYSQLIDRGFDLPGTEVSDVITGTNGTDRLQGLAGADTLTAGPGHDTLDGGTGSDLLDAGPGDDTLVYSADDLWTTGFIAVNSGSPDVPGTGLRATIAGKNRSYDVFDGGDGYDVLRGSDGDDALALDDQYSPFPGAAGPRLRGIEAIYANAGNDVIDLTSSVHAYGDVLLDGGAGDDVLWSSAGNDTLLGGDGNDNLYAGAGDDVLFGGIGNDTLDGGPGADSLTGGAGNDIYLVDNPGDTITELPGEGTDTVKSAMDYTLGANLENLTLTGTAHLNGRGNELNNVLTGNAGVNVLAGGAGHDTYVIGPEDTVIELPGEGTDTVRIGTSYTLGDHIENLVLTGTAPADATGNALNNVLTGNAAGNRLTGGAGNDNLRGGLGNDTYVFEAGWGVDTVVENDGTAGNTDTALFASGIGPLDLVFARTVNDLRVTRHGSSDAVVFKDWNLGAAYHAELFQAGNQLLVDSRLDQLIQAMAQFSADNGGITWDQAIDQRPEDVSAILTAYWQPAA